MWQEEQDESIGFVPPDDVQDVLFSIRCQTLPVDHAQALSEAVLTALPWFADEPLAGIHLIHVAGSMNGWERPSGGDGLLHLSRRTKLVLRVPKQRLPEVMQLTGQSLDVAGNEMVIGEASTRLLSVTTTLYARHVAVEDPEQSEQAFTRAIVDSLQARGLRFKKVLCGKSIFFQTAQGPLMTRSLMVADLPYEDAIRLQESGVGDPRWKKLGCGLFIAHKSV